MVLYRLVLMNTRSSRPMLHSGLSTRSQLLAGVLATPLFFTVGLAQAFTRPGFDLSRHFLSQLSAGEYGWLQMANFLVSGALYVICAAAMARTLAPGRGATWGPRLIGVFGLGLVAAGLFSADPANGYPAGAVDSELSWHGMAHGFAALGAGLALTAATFVFAARYVTQKRTGAAIATALVGIAYFILPWTVPSLASVLLVVASIIAWGWVSLMALHLAISLSENRRDVQLLMSTAS
jgi:hypothetical protein